jgi:hypothetical protein
MKIIGSSLIIASTVLAGAALVAPAANASGGTGDVRASGTCTGASTWKLKAKPDNGRIDVAFEVDSNVVGQTWSVRITDNGTAVFTGTRRTTAPSGSFTVAPIVPNRAGADAFVARATNSATGESCVGRVTL